MVEPFPKRDITYLGITDWREPGQRFGIQDTSRLYHTVITGKTGVGKSTLIANMAIQDMRYGHACAVLDSHGDLIDDLLDFVPEHRIPDVIYFNAADPDFAIGFNPLANVSPEHHHLVTSSITATFKRLFADGWGNRLEHHLRYSTQTLLEYDNGATLLDIPRLLTDPHFRATVLERVKSPHLLSFWKNEHDKGGTGFKIEAVASVINKFSILTANAPLRRILGQRKQSFTLQQVLDEGKILFVNVSRGIIGGDAALFLGSMLISMIQHAAFFRATKPASQRKPFYLYVDEIETYATATFIDALSQSRKYGLGLILACQYLDQLSDQIRTAVFGNVGTIISFQVGAIDSRYLVREFPIFKESDFITIKKHHYYIKLCIEGETSQPFSAISLQLPSKREPWREYVIRSSSNAYARKRSDIEEELTRRFQQIKPPRQSSLF